MPLDTTNPLDVQAITAAALRGQQTEAMARQIYAMGTEAVVTLATAVNTRLAVLAGGAQAIGAHTPSGALPTYAKGSIGKKRPGRPGARNGHKGQRRPPPTIDRRESVAPITVCPDCGGGVLPARKNRRRTVEDIKPDAKFEAVEYTIPQHWCASCKKHVEPGVAAAMPGATIGNGVVALSAVMHYGLASRSRRCRRFFRAI